MQSNQLFANFFAKLLRFVEQVVQLKLFGLVLPLIVLVKHYQLAIIVQKLLHFLLLLNDFQPFFHLYFLE